MLSSEEVPVKEIAYWPDGYFIADEDASEQGEILDSVDAFGEGRHTLLLVPVSADQEAMQVLVNTELEQVTLFSPGAVT